MSYIEAVRSRVGNKKIILVFSSVVLQDGSGRILLQRRSDFDFWGLPGGILELGEDLLTCAHRELEEETGLRAGPLRLVGIYTDPQYDVVYPNGHQVQQFTVCFAGRVAGGRMKPDGIETREQQFFERGQLASLETPLWYRDMIRDALSDGFPAFSAPFIAEHVEAQFPFSVSYARDMPFIAVGAAAAVEDGEGRLLAVRSQDKSNWSLPKGYTLLGENAAHTAVRCTLELTGFFVAPERLIGVHSLVRSRPNCHDGQLEVVRAVFRARPADPLVRSDTLAGGQVTWIRPESLVAQAAANDRLLLEQTISHLDHGYFVV